jgi:predicted hotdog family 3-hydroxylacyl-ACP dehydratase
MISGKNKEVLKNAPVTGEALKDYIPQREPIVMVDAFYGIDGDQSFSGLTVKEDNLFVEDGLLNESGIIEHIAQSCALRVGYFCKQQHIPVPVGYIGAIKKMKIFGLPQVGQQLFTTVTILQEVFDITLVAVEVTVEETLIAGCEMKIFLDKNS